MTEPRRSLSPLEAAVLREVQDYWGLQNQAEEVHLNQIGEAVLFVVAPDGSRPVMINLTNLGAWHADGTLTLDVLREWVRGPMALDLADRLVTVMMPLLDEGVDVWRRVKAEALPSGWYRVLSRIDRRDDEQWTFEVGDVVVCEQRQLSDGRHLLIVDRRRQTG